MSYRELYLIKKPISFAGREGSGEKARIRVIGVPFDSTASFRPGQRFAPAKIREASIGMETNGYFAEGYLEDLPIEDEGDIAVVPGDAKESIERVRKVSAEMFGEKRMVAIIGGEHTVTIGAVRGARDAGIRPCLLVFDAHLDLRDEYLGYRYSHASTFRRLLEGGGERLIYVGARAFAKEEAELAERIGAEIFSPRKIDLMGTANVLSAVRRALEPCKSIYISIDMDAYDPSFAPGVGNPEPMGLSPREMLPLIASLVDERMIGIDVVEVSPPYDSGEITSILAAKTLAEALISYGRFI